MEWHDATDRRTIACGTADVTTDIAVALPATPGTVTLIADGPVTWVDPRIVRDMRMGLPALWAGLFVARALLWHRRRPDREDASGWTQAAWFKAGTVFVSLLTAVLFAEAALRLIGVRVSEVIAAERHDLGQLTRDPLWEDSPRYERRVRRSAHAINEGRQGGIVRLGDVPAAPAPGRLHRVWVL